MDDRATSQREMDITFEKEKDKFIVIYMDDRTIFSNVEEDHPKNLK
jgi:hypothetical protein